MTLLLYHFIGWSSSHIEKSKNYTLGRVGNFSILGLRLPNRFPSLKYSFSVITFILRSAVKKNSKFDCQRTDDQISIRKNIAGSNKRFEDLVVKNNIDTVHKIWKNSVKLYGEKNCLGTRLVAINISRLVSFVAFSCNICYKKNSFLFK